MTIFVSAVIMKDGVGEPKGEWILVRAVDTVSVA
jgi:hypothetical protein